MFSEAETDAGSLRRAFNAAVENYPRHLAQFLSRDAEAAFKAWWGKFYEAIHNYKAGLAILAEIETLRERVKELEKGTKTVGQELVEGLTELAADLKSGDLSRYKVTRIEIKDEPTGT